MGGRWLKATIRNQALPCGNGTKRVVATGADRFDFIVGQCLVSDGNSAC